MDVEKYARKIINKNFKNGGIMVSDEIKKGRGRKVRKSLGVIFGTVILSAVLASLGLMVEKEAEIVPNQTEQAVLNTKAELNKSIDDKINAIDTKVADIDNKMGSAKDTELEKLEVKRAKLIEYKDLLVTEKDQLRSHDKDDLTITKKNLESLDKSYRTYMSSDQNK
ncbi:hypothetical protein [Salibacter sp.]|uniref:hypothetical protein n=1 Tax=Salibacter sp. TaxID=2010995 RepID=UPI0028701A26|nr:hypothetical protein [Salibacter sp.]MDR9486630.1 hypothetical protein [Salibacter sp.]